MEDSKIIELFFERSEDAISALSEKYGKLCIKTAVNILGSKEDAEECVNDAYLGLWNTIPPQNPNPLVSYLLRVVRNISTAKYHSKSAKKRNSFYDVALDELCDCISSGDFVEDSLDAKEIAEIIDKFLGRLDRDSRVMFVRRYYCADSLEELSKLFGISRHALSVKLSRIREKLKKELLKEGIYL